MISDLKVHLTLKMFFAKSVESTCYLNHLSAKKIKFA